MNDAALPSTLRVAGGKVLWLPDREGEAVEVPEWLMVRAENDPGCFIDSGQGSIFPQSTELHAWIVVDRVVEPAVVLNELSDLRERLTDGGFLWVRLLAGGDEWRAGKQRWQWLADLALRQGYESHGVERVHGKTDYLVLQKSLKLAHRWRLRSPTDSDAVACGELFVRAFDHVISQELWDWKYGEGRGRATMAMRDARAIAHYGCVTRRIMLLGREAHALQICDVMVDPAERAIMTRTGAFFKVARSAQEAFIGYGVDHDLGYGFPNQRHMLLAEKMGLYDEVGRMVELEWRTDRKISRPWSTVCEISDVKKLGREILGRLWDQMRRRCSGQILVVRDADYFNYRYWANPQHEYVALVVRRRISGRILGIAIVRREADEGKLMDVLGDPGYFRRLVCHARLQAAQWGLTSLSAWVTENCADWLANETMPRKMTEIVIPLNAHARIHSAESIRDRWFLMMGDTDFL